MLKHYVEPFPTRKVKLIADRLINEHYADINTNVLDAEQMVSILPNITINIYIMSDLTEREKRDKECIKK